MDLKDTYNRIAEDWHNDHHQDDWWVEGTDTFISLLTPGAEVLDVGCGSGTKTKYLSERGLKVTGIDFSDKLIEIATREVHETKFLVMDMHDVPTMDQKFDGVFAQASLLHIPRNEIPDVLKGLLSVLKPGGHLYGAVNGTRLGHPDEEIKEENDYGYTYERFFSYTSMDELKAYFQDLNLNVVYENTNTVGRTNWLQIIGKNS
jgi:SAM-dependent methyltransferase